MYISSLLLLALAGGAIGSPVAPENDNLLRLPIMRKQRTTDMLTARRHRNLQKRDPFQTSLYNDEGSQYLVQVGIGTPAQNFIVTLDTGSADLWVPSTQCPTSQCPYTRFDSNQSSTFKSTGETFGIQYGIGSVNGTYVTDTVTVANASVQNQQFGLATSTQDILTTTTVGGTGSDTPSVNTSSSSGSPVANGILGLGYPKLTAGTNSGQAAYNPFVFNLVSQKVIQQSIFSVYMNSADQEGWAGEVIFGGTDSSKYTGDIQYLPVAQLEVSSSPLDQLLGGSSSTSAGYYYWMVYGQGVQVVGGSSGGVDIQLNSVAPFIIDTGTTLTYLPTSYAVKVAEAIAGSDVVLDTQSSAFIVDCSVANTNTSFEIKMSQSSSISDSPVTLSVPISELVIPLDALTLSKATQCMLGIAPMSSSGSSVSDMFLIGDSVLRSAYLVFDMGENRIGFAAANNVGGSVNGVGSTSTSDAPVAVPIKANLVALAVAATAGIILSL